MSGTSKIPEDILDDLSSRFIINIPKHERTGLNRISFQIELAHWFYLDYYCVQNSELKPYKLKEFFYYIFQHIPFLKKYESDLDKIYTEWREYKLMVPTFGAVLLDDSLSNILLVQSYMAPSWGFPKGKVNQEEDPVDCACREVFEETGIDISKLINPNEYVESTIHDQLIRLYFIIGIDKNVTFEPQTRCEIKAVRWFPIEQLPISKKDIIVKSRMYEPRYFYMVIPFIKRILNWIEDRRRSIPNTKYKKNERLQNKLCSDAEQYGSPNKSKKMQNQNEKRKLHPLNRVVQPERTPDTFNYLKSELLINDEFHHSFDSLTIDAEISRTSKKKLRNLQRARNRKIRSDNYLELKTQLENGSARWKNFRFNREIIIQHLKN
ncbi:hypothetical protein PGB90_003546 [Kerria lacca]